MTVEQGPLAEATAALDLSLAPREVVMAEFYRKNVKVNDARRQRS